MSARSRSTQTLRVSGSSQSLSGMVPCWRKITTAAWMVHLPVWNPPTNMDYIYTRHKYVPTCWSFFFCGAWAPQGIHWSPWWLQEFLDVACSFPKWLELDFENDCLWNLPPPCLYSSDLPYCIAGKLNVFSICMMRHLPPRSLWKMTFWKDGGGGRPPIFTSLPRISIGFNTFCWGYLSGFVLNSIHSDGGTP